MYARSTILTLMLVFTLGFSLTASAVPEIDGPDALETTLARLGNVHGDTLSDDDLLRLETHLFAQDAEVRDRILDMVDAFLDYEAAAHMVYGDIDAETLAAVGPLLDTLQQAHGADDLDLDALQTELTRVLDETGATAAAAHDITPILETRDTLVSAMALLDEATPDGGLRTSGSCQVSLGPVLVINQCQTDDTYTTHVALLYDEAGNDRYLNNGGGTGSLLGTCSILSSGAAALYDAAGDDRYGAQTEDFSCGFNGGAMVGAGLLVDRAGNDEYLAWQTGVNGGGFLGVGLLRDDGGHDRYRAGPDTFVLQPDNTTSWSTAGEAVNGGAFSFLNIPSQGGIQDGGGDDRYEAGVDELTILPDPDSTCGERFWRDCVTVRVAVNAVNGGAIGLLGSDVVGQIVDEGGNDTYWAGIGRLATGSGSNTTTSVTAASSAVNGGTYSLNIPSTMTAPYQAVVGLILDEGGSDTYTAGVGTASLKGTHGNLVAGSAAVNGGGFALINADGEGDILDRGTGADAYHVGIDNLSLDGSKWSVSAAFGAVNGGAYGPGHGRVLDEGGHDTYRAGIAEVTVIGIFNDLSAGTIAVNGGAILGSGALIDRGGDDAYAAGIPDVSKIAAGNNVTHGDDAVNGGAFAGSGLLLDEGGLDVYFDMEGGTGTDKTVVPKGPAGAQVDLS